MSDTHESGGATVADIGEARERFGAPGRVRTRPTSVAGWWERIARVEDIAMTSRFVALHFALFCERPAPRGEYWIDALCRECRMSKRQATACALELRAAGLMTWETGQIELMGEIRATGQAALPEQPGGAA